MKQKNDSSARLPHDPDRAGRTFLGRKERRGKRGDQKGMGVVERVVPAVSPHRQYPLRRRVRHYFNHDEKLDFSTNADIMSDMKTFTVRELDREPAAVLDAADRDGVVEIRRRDGRVYALQPKTSGERITGLPDFRARARKIFSRPIPQKFVAMADRLIAGE